MGPGPVTTPWDCAEIRAALGVYVVGAIDPADRAIVDSHLALCTGCREEVAGLAALPGRLGSVPDADVTMLVLEEPGRDGPPEAVLRSLLGRAAALRRRLRWRRVAAALAVAVIASGGAVAVSRVVDPAAPRPAASALPWGDMAHGRDPLTGAAATVRYLARPWGIQMRVQVSRLSPGTRCELLVVGPGGRVAAGGWIVTAGHADAWYPASAPLGVPGVRGFVVASATGKALVSVPVR
jgi:Putative zinc-finger